MKTLFIEVLSWTSEAEDGSWCGSVGEGILAQFHVEPGDDSSQIASFLRDIKKFHRPGWAVVVEPFRHLSSSHCNPVIATEITHRVIEACRKEFGEIMTSPFGVNKRLHITSRGTPGAFRFRSY